jgi:hypothetical protein
LLIFFLGLDFHLFFYFSKSQHFSFGRFTWDATTLVDNPIW